jgi:hypothetical protein
MNEQMAGFVIFVSLALFVSAACHYYTRAYFFASLIASALTVTGAQILFRIYYGNWDPFLTISSVTMGFSAWLIALVAGLPFVLYRRRKS